MQTEKHPFEPFLPANARILFLGSFPPQPHRWCMPFYYPNWINDFWRIMGLIHFGDKDHFCIVGEKRFDEEAIRAFCTREGLAFYDGLIDALLENHIEPLVTLYHFECPQALVEVFGGWKSRKMCDAFEAYARVCFEHFKGRVKKWVTVNGVPSDLKTRILIIRSHTSNRKVT